MKKVSKIGFGVLHLQWIRNSLPSFLRRFSHNMMIIIPPPVTNFSLADITAKFRTKLLQAEQAATRFSYQHTDVWFLCKTNLEH